MKIIVGACLLFLGITQTYAASATGIQTIDPPEQGFYSKRLDYQGIPIKASAVVSDDALLAAHARLYMMLRLLPVAVDNLTSVASELHVIGKNQVTSDLPEFNDLKDKPYDGDLTVDQRTRGLGGVNASCGEENLLGLNQDRYKGIDICVHEFAHTIQLYGLSKSVQNLISRQFQRAISQGLWKGTYASTNEREYFAELSVWYFGSHGEMSGLPGAKPGQRWLRSYDLDGSDLVERIYSGELEDAKEKIVPLTKLPPGREGELRSYTGAAVQVTFINRTQRTLRIYWLDYEGHRKPYGAIPPGGRRLQPTFQTHTFVITDAQDRALEIFVVGNQSATAVILEAEITAQ
jgi:hypothetical protein